MTLDREAVARIIDPLAWKYADKYSMYPEMKADAAFETKESLAKADQITALGGSSSQGSDPTPQAPDAGLRKALESFPSLPKVYQWTGDNDLEALFDNELRHENGKRPVDYLNGWLSMLRPFAFASRDDSWGEMEKLLCIVMRNYVRMMIAVREALSAAATPEAPPSGWKPIESAPRDATSVLLWAVGHQPAVGWWVPYAGSAGGGYWHPKSAPTHWQPLPAPPADAKVKG